ncbi:MAG: hypothetical protein HYW25_00700 [Candidatus Aenigmarchaeota archaeon]|nr:hypothetical protein [Candidatus Aenigmarchaeota archaeon]
MKGVGIDFILGTLIAIAMLGLFYNLVTTSVIANNRITSKIGDISSAYAAIDAFRISYDGTLERLAKDSASFALQKRFGMPFSADFTDADMNNALASALATPASVSEYLESDLSSATVPAQAKLAYNNRPFDVVVDFMLKTISLPYEEEARFLSEVSLLVDGVQIDTDTRYENEATSGKRIRNTILNSWSIASFITRTHHQLLEPLQYIEDTPRSRRAELFGIVSSNSVFLPSDSASYFVNAKSEGSGISYSISSEIGETRKMFVTGLSPPECGIKKQEYDRYAGAIEKALPDRLLPYVDNPRSLIAAVIEVQSSWTPIRSGLTGMTASKTPGEEILLLVNVLEDKADELKMDKFYADSGMEVVEELLGRIGLSPDEINNILSLYSSWEKCPFNNPFPEGSFSKPLEGPVIKCYGDPACSGTAPSEEFYPGIDIFGKPGSDVSAIHEGRLIKVTIRVGSQIYQDSFSLIYQDPETRRNFITIYNNVEPVPDTSQNYFKAGDKIGTVKDIGNLSYVTIIIAFLPLSDPFLHIEDYTINPCLLIGCIPQTPGLGEFPYVFRALANPEDYAAFLSGKNEKNIFLGERFCTETNIKERGFRNLGYSFYSADENLFEVYPAFPGKVVKVMRGDFSGSGSWYGCGGAVFVETETPSGSFITAYGGTTPFVSEGDFASRNPFLGKSIIGGVSNFHGLCPEPHLDVRIFEKSYIPEESITNACGTAVSECTVAPPAPDEISTTVYAFKNHCAALEWEAVSRASFSPTLAKKQLALNYEKIPEALRTRMEVTSPASCEGDGRFKWQDTEDALCMDGQIHICTTTEQASGENILYEDMTVGSYTCRIFEEGLRDRCVEHSGNILLEQKCGQKIQNPDFEKYANWVSQKLAGPPSQPESGTLFTRVISKLCSSEEDQKDYTCCVASGKTYRCTGSVALDPTSFELTCNGEAACTS